MVPIPTTEDQLILFAAELAQARVVGTVGATCSVRHMHIVKGWPNPLDDWIWS